MTDLRDHWALSARLQRLIEKKRKRLASEARKLAIEIVKGTAPRFGTGEEFFCPSGRPCCAMGHVARRAGLRGSDFPDWSPIASAVSRHDREEFGGAWVLTANANDRLPDALPWALLSLADAIEDAAEPPSEKNP